MLFRSSLFILRLKKAQVHTSQMWITQEFIRICRYTKWCTWQNIPCVRRLQYIVLNLNWFLECQKHDNTKDLTKVKSEVSWFHSKISKPEIKLLAPIIDFVIHHIINIYHSNFNCIMRILSQALALEFYVHFILGINYGCTFACPPALRPEGKKSKVLRETTPAIAPNIKENVQYLIL